MYIGHAQMLGRGAQESARLLTRRSAMPSLDLDSVVSLARADSAISTGICLTRTKSQGLKLQRCSQGARTGAGGAAVSASGRRTCCAVPHRLRERPAVRRPADADVRAGRRRARGTGGGGAQRFKPASPCRLTPMPGYTLRMCCLCGQPYFA